MTDTTTSPSGTVDNAPLSFDEGVNAIAGLLDDDPVTDPVKTEVAKPSDPNAVADPVPGPDDISDDDLVLDDADLGDLAPAAPEAPSTVNDETEVTLDDGTKISIGQLKRNNLYQRDYSQKTEALAQQRKQFEQEVQQRVSEAERDIAQRRDLILDNWQLIVPKEPVYDPNDPVSFIEETAVYNERMKTLNSLWQQKQQESQAAEQRQKEEYQRHVAEQKAKTLELLPHLKDATKLKSFYDDVSAIGSGLYGISPEEFKSIDDARYYRIFHDAIQYQKIRQKAASVQKQVATKPKLVQQQRQPQQAIQNRDRQGRFEALRQTGSIDAAAKSIEDLID